MFTDLIFDTIKMAIFSKRIYIFNTVPTVSGTIQESVTRKVDKMILNCIWKDAEKLKQKKKEERMEDLYCLIKRITHSRIIKL